MEVSELKEKKEKLEKDLLELITTFENETRLNISSVGITTINSGSSLYGYTANVSTEIKL